MELSVIIPAYNEEENIAETVLGTDAYLAAKGSAYEIIVIDDGSRDGTPEILKSLKAKVPSLVVLLQNPNRGKGEAVKRGIHEARYGHCLFMDADHSTPIEAWDAFEPLFRRGAKVVIASRHLPGSKIRVPQPWARRVLGAGYRRICRMLFGLNISDFNCGFKAYESPLAKEIYRQAVMKDWTFDVEIFCLLKQRGVQAEEVPVVWSHSEKETRIKPFSTAVRMLSSLAALKKRFRS